MKTAEEKVDINGSGSTRAQAIRGGEKPARSILPRAAERERLQIITNFRTALDAILTDPAFEPITLALVVTKNLAAQGVSHRDRLHALLVEPKHSLCLQVLDSFSGRLRFATARKLLRSFGTEQTLHHPRDVSLSPTTTRRVLDRLAFYIKRDYARYKRAQRDLFEHHFGLAIEIAKELSSGSRYFEDAVQEGALGLLEAIDKAEVRAETTFAGYAAYWIRKSIVDLQGGNRYLLYVPIGFVRLIRKIQNRFAEQPLETAERDPDRFAASQGLTIEALKAFIALRHGAVFLDEPVGDGDVSRGEMVADVATPTPAEMLARKDAREYLQRALNYLTPQQRAVILLRYGLGDDPQPHSQNEVAKRVGVCFQRVSRLERAALDRFRKLLPRAVLRDVWAALM